MNENSQINTKTNGMTSLNLCPMQQYSHLIHVAMCFVVVSVCVCRVLCIWLQFFSIIFLLSVLSVIVIVTINFAHGMRLSFSIEPQSNGK